MRPFRFVLYDSCFNMSEPRFGAPVPAQARRMPRRRLDDQIETLYHRACIVQDLEAASDLLTLLEKWFQRRSARSGTDRRNDAGLRRARRELDRLTQARQSRR
jgi:hypothetical protein